MWFKNLQIYRLTEKFTLSVEELAQQLSEKAFRPCSGLESERYGWTAPLGKDSDQLIFSSNGKMVFCTRREERVLPAAVVREAVDEKVDEISQKEARHVGRKEKMDIKDEVLLDLMPRAFTKSTHIFSYIDPQNDWMIIDCSSANRAEDILKLMRDSLGSFKVKPLSVEQSPAAVMTAWVKQAAPADIEILDECEIRETADQGGVVRIKGIDLASQEVQQHLDGNSQISRLAIEWQQRISCVLHDDLSIKRLKFGDEILDEAGDTDAEDAAMRFDADFNLMSLELSRFIPALCNELGGVQTDRAETD